MRFHPARNRRRGLLSPLAVLATVSLTAGVLGVTTPAFAGGGPGGPATQVVASVSGDFAAGVPKMVTLTAEDANGTLVSTYTSSVQVFSIGSRASYPGGSAVALVGGTGTLYVELDTAGPQTLFTLPPPAFPGDTQPAPTGSSLPVTVDPGMTDSLAISAPATVTAGVPFSYTVNQLDVFDNIVPTGDLLGVFPFNPGYVAGGSIYPAGSGTYTETFNTLGNASIFVSDEDSPVIAPATVNITVDPPVVATHYLITADQPEAPAGYLSQITVKAVDDNGLEANLDTPVTVTATDQNAIVNGADPVVDLVNGQATFPVEFTTAGDQTLTATGDALTGSGDFIVDPTQAVSSIVAITPTAVAGDQVIVTSTALDQFGNVAADDFDAGMAVAWSSNADGGNPATVDYTAGVATLTGSFTAAGNGYVQVDGPAGTVQADITITAAPVAGTVTGPVAGPVVSDRIAGADRVSTAAAVSVKEFPTAGSAGAVVLARSDDAADATVGTVLAEAKNAPLLFSTGNTVPAATLAEITRAIPAGGTVYLLGGMAAVPDSVATQLTAAGFKVVRIAGADRYDTAVAVAETVGGNGPVLLATGSDFADALTAGPAAAHNSGVVLLTDGTTMPASVTAYLTTHSGKVFAIGGQAAAADPHAAAVVGDDRYATAVDVATKFFTAPDSVGVASGATFADALSGGAYLAHLGAPLLLSTPSALSASSVSYLASVKGSVRTAFMFGGTSAVSDTVDTAVTTALGN
jgi:putative cell wall-binding protein